MDDHAFQNLRSLGEYASYPDTDEIILALDDCGVLLITWNRPERHNAWTAEFQDAYMATLVSAANDQRVRAIVVTGAGKSFCPGRDIQILEAASEDGGATRRMSTWSMSAPLHIPKPIILAINGLCAGLAIVQVACADKVFASTNARFNTSFARRGLPAEYGLSWLLPRIVGTANALDLMLSSRMVSAEEAKEMGLVSRVTTPDNLLPDALAYARDLTRHCSPAAMAQIKRQVVIDWERGAREAIESAAALSEKMGAGPDFIEGVSSFSEKRPPAFAGYGAGIDASPGNKDFRV